MAVTLAPRKFTPGHFAFMRAVVQGIDVRASWDRYLRVEGEHEDLRKVRSTIARMREDFAAAARRNSKPGTARLIRLEAGDSQQATGLPSLAAFVVERGLDDLSERDQQAASVEAYGPGTDAERRSRRARLIRRQLEALQWLERLVAQEPGPNDDVAAWFTPAIAAPLQEAGLHTLADLIGRINGIGARWWTAVPGVGDLKGKRIVAWLRLHEPTIGIRVGFHVGVRRTALKSTQLDMVVGRATGVVPFEKLMLPMELDGREGRFRAPAHQCLLEARNDYEAIAAWLATKHDPNGTGKTATHRAYRKEAERLLLWAVLERGKALSSLTVEDINAFKWFLAKPPPHWCGPRHHQRWSPLWRPLEGSLSSSALRHAMVILRSMYGFLVSQNYVIGNPVAGVSLPRETGLVLGSQRTLTFEQWDGLDAQLDALSREPVGRRRARAVRWLYATGLRLSEIVNARCGDLQLVAYRLPDGKSDSGWLLNVLGKGDKWREVPVPQRLIDELRTELGLHGLDPDVRHESNHGVAVLAQFENGVAKPLSASGLAKGIKALLETCAEDMGLESGKQLRKASAHWLRHAHGSHALNGRPDAGGGVPIQVVQNNLGHASIGTTSGYLTTERDARLAAMKGFGD